MLSLMLTWFFGWGQNCWLRNHRVRACSLANGSQIARFEFLHHTCPEGRRAGHPNMWQQGVENWRAKDPGLKSNSNTHSVHLALLCALVTLNVALTYQGARA